MVKKHQQRIEVFSLRIDEARLLSNYRRLPPDDKLAAVGAMEEYLNRLQPKRPSKPEGDHQYGGSA